MVGRVQFEEDGDFIDCTRMGVGGKAIPPYIDKITNIQSDAKFILVRACVCVVGRLHKIPKATMYQPQFNLREHHTHLQLVEKEAAYMRLAEDRFYNKYPCIVITAKGQPDVATRLFLKKLKTTLHIPVLGLVDSDPYGTDVCDGWRVVDQPSLTHANASINNRPTGLKILSVYMTGSKNMSYDSASLTTSDIKVCDCEQRFNEKSPYVDRTIADEIHIHQSYIQWLGVRPSDLDRYNLPEQCRLDMTEFDIRTGPSVCLASLLVYMHLFKHMAFAFSSCLILSAHILYTN